MKQILFPTDFSKIAWNAVDYAAELARHTDSKLILFHVFQMPVLTTEVPVIMPTLKEIEEERMEHLEKLKKKILAKKGLELKIECLTACGVVVDEINYLAEKNKIDLIVIGMQGAGYISEKIIGSVTTTLIRKSKLPVLAIDKHVRYEGLKKIVLAVDYEEPLAAVVLKPLYELAKTFNSHIYVLNVMVPELEEISTQTKVQLGKKLKQSFKEIKHSFHYMENDEIIEGINQFISEKNMDMIVMIPHTHNLFKRIFQEPFTKQMAFHTKVPLLTLHHQNA